MSKEQVSTVPRHLLQKRILAREMQTTYSYASILLGREGKRKSGGEDQELVNPTRIVFSLFALKVLNRFTMV